MKWYLTTAIAAWGVMCMPGVASAGSRADHPCAPDVTAQAQAGGRVPEFTAGLDKRSGTGWLIARYGDLQIKKTALGRRAVTIDLTHQNDTVTLSVVEGKTSVARNGRTLEINGPDALRSVQELLAASPAMFAARVFLSEREVLSTFRPAEMSTLAAAAFAVSLTGDTNAPLRIADRFMLRHRGLFRPILLGESCWSAYSDEVSASWNELQGCMADAEDDGFWSGAWQRSACNAVWLLRSESAWFEYLGCVSPLGAVKL